MSTPSHLLDNLKIQGYDFDPDATTATEIAWFDLRDFEEFVAGFFRTIGTSNVTFKIMANTASDGSGTDVDIVTYSGDEPNAVGDQIYLETSAKQVAQKGTDAGVDGLRYVTAVASVATGTDEGVVTYVAKGNRGYDGLTSDIIA